MRIGNDLADEGVLAELGRRVARVRLDRNLTQQQLADEAGVSRHTVLRVEDGAGSTLTALVRVLRALQLLEGMELLVPEPLPSPIEQLEREGERRRRAAGSREAGQKTPEAWHWGTP